MNEVNKILRDLLEREEALLELLEECFGKIYREEHRKRAWSQFREDYLYGFHYNGCLQGLDMIDAELLRQDESSKKYAEERAKIANAQNETT